MTVLTEAQIEEAATFIKESRGSGGALSLIPEGFRPETLADAYRIAQAVRDPSAVRPEAWKAGASSPKQMSALGLDSPPRAPLFRNVVCESPAELDASRFHRCVMEAEVAFRMSGSLPPRAEPYSMEEVQDAVGSAHIAIEAANFPFDDGMAAGLPSVVAAGLAVGKLVMGPEIEDWRERDLKALEWEVLVDGEVRGRAKRRGAAGPVGGAARRRQ